MDRRTSFLKALTHTLILFNPAVQWSIHHLLSPVTQIALHYMISTNQDGSQNFHRGTIALLYTPRNTKMSPFLCFSLPPTVSACPISLTTE